MPASTTSSSSASASSLRCWAFVLRLFPPPPWGLSDMFLCSGASLPRWLCAAFAQRCVFSRGSLLRIQARLSRTATLPSVLANHARASIYTRPRVFLPICKVFKTGFIRLGPIRSDPSDTLSHITSGLLTHQRRRTFRSSGASPARRRAARDVRAAPRARGARRSWRPFFAPRPPAPRCASPARKAPA